MAERTNEQWLDDLRGDAVEEALADLRIVIVRGLRGALAKYDNVADADIEDFAQDALLKVVKALDSFRGESRFTTWAQKIAVRVALSEMRRLRWRDWSLDQMMSGRDSEEGSDFVPAFMADPAASPEQQAVQSNLLSIVQKTIAEKLSDRQRTALVAVQVHGVPLEEVAQRMETNRNALYKLLHDARRRLKSELLDAGLSADEILAAFDR